ncbi:MAG: ccmI [Panacagrimonas sp.]|nr:c-type cytochrome biogenesis protein CcmI [Panacagrimonas sp.]MCC2655117.1 ccmI [Panacagrimonas sp.]
MGLALMVLLTVAASAWLTRPLWRGHVDRGQRRRAANVAAYRQRLAEIQADNDAGLLDADTAASLRGELDARLLRDAEGDEAVGGSTSRRSGALAAALAAVVLAVAAGGYFESGSWKTQQRIAGAPSADGDGQSVEEMVGRLAQRLEQNPDDPQGWALLGRSYFVMQRYAEAAQAYGRANTLTAQREPQLLVGEGEALGLSQDRDLRGRPRELFDAALAIAPDDGKALWYAGLAAAQAGEPQIAKTHWQALARQELPPDLRAVLDERLRELGAEPAAAAPALASAQTDAPVLRVAVSLSPTLREQVPADATLYVFAKAAAGPPMPLAVFRGSARDLPREVSLDDSMAMSPAAKLSQFDRWTVTARVTRSGQPQAASGDLQGSLTVARGELGESALALVIGEVVP